METKTTIQQKIQTLKNIISVKLNIDLSDRTRRRELVDARAICFKIMRDELNMTFKSIGMEFRKDHATVMHSLRNFKTLLKYDKTFEKSYYNVLYAWQDTFDEYVDLSPITLKKEANDLAEQNKMLTLSLIDVQERWEKDRKRLRRYRNIIRTLDTVEKEEDIEILEARLNSIVNGLRL